MELQVRFAAALMIIASVTFITIYFCTDLAIQAPTASPVTGIALMIALIVWAKNRTAALARAKTR
ncbi:MAG: hypothetical protein NTX15_09890 [Candidatus Kapabacteria bacterium]|nr:hypothetical protein [Candidatus Kapabacteria bacterium]